MKQYEMLPDTLYREKELSHNLDSIEWIDTTEDYLIESLTKYKLKDVAYMNAINRNITEEELNKFDIDYIKDNLALGKVIKGYSEYFRLKEEYVDRCPSCGCAMDNIFYSLSRRDNLTHIYDDCAEKESFESMFAYK